MADDVDDVFQVRVGDGAAHGGVIGVAFAVAAHDAPLEVQARDLAVAQGLGGLHQFQVALVGGDAAHGQDVADRLKLVQPVEGDFLLGARRQVDQHRHDGHGLAGERLEALAVEAGVGQQHVAGLADGFELIEALLGVGRHEGDVGEEFGRRDVVIDQRLALRQGQHVVEAVVAQRVVVDQRRALVGAQLAERFDLARDLGVDVFGVDVAVDASASQQLLEIEHPICDGVAVGRAGMELVYAHWADTLSIGRMPARLDGRSVVLAWRLLRQARLAKRPEPPPGEAAPYD